MTKYILSIDGGGIKGAIPASILTVLQSKLKERKAVKPLHHYFDLIAGTSTGAIIAAGLTCPKPKQPKQPAADPAKLVNLYLERGPEIFAKTPLRRLTNFGGLFDESYDATALENILIEMLGAKTEIRDALTKVLITGYDIRARAGIFLTNADKEHERFYFWQAVRGSSAAPTYFEPALVDDLAKGADGRQPSFPMIDGGVFANDPAMAAYVEGCKMKWTKDGEDIVILSLGTGSANREIHYQQAKNWGAAGWISPSNGTPLISILMQGQASTASYQLNKLLNDHPAKFTSDGTVVTEANRKTLKYFRINGELDGVNDELDDVRPENIKGLVDLGQRFAKKHSLALDEIADRLAAKS